MTDQSPATTDQHLVIRGLRVAPLGKLDQEILQGIDLTVGKGEVHAIMGPNGSGKTTLAYALMGHPAYVVTGGEVIWKGRNILKLSPDKRARLGMFLAFQYPTAVPGLSVASFIRSAQNKVDYPRASYCLFLRDRFVNRPTSRAAAEYSRAIQAPE